MEYSDAVNKQLLRGVFRFLRYASIEPDSSMVDECLQEAWLRLLQAPGESENLPRCGCLATQNFFRRWTKRHPLPLSLTEDTRQSNCDSKIMPHRIVEKLPTLLLAGRQDKERGQRAVAKEVEILRLLWRGATNERIATELSIPTNSVKVSRQRIKERLKTIYENDKSNNLRGL